MAEGENIVPITIEDEMRGAYIDYSMSVIVSRALPDARDGLKPVHRRILYAMDELGMNYNKPYKKSARIVGEVLGKYHPHGDSAVYETMVRMAQSWSMRYQLIDGQGNFGSIDGDPPAAMRYTEARLQRISDELLADMKKETVDYQNNFDDSLEEPLVLPAKLPNLLINGAAGIAVGMATNMAPHNLSEVIDGINAYIDNRDITIEELIQYIKAPDFPTGAAIYGYHGIKEMYETGRGRVRMRAKAEIVENKNKTQIVVTEFPYQVNKAQLIIKASELVRDGDLEGISEIRDESDKEGYRLVYDLKKDAVPHIVLNNLYKYTQLQTTFPVNNVALVKGRPMTLNLKDLIYHFVEHRHDVVTRRTQYELREAEKRAHLLEGYMIILGRDEQGNNRIDEVIEIIKSSRDPEVARTTLMENFGLSEVQARAILDLQLRRLTGMEIDKIEKEYKEIKDYIADLKDILERKERRMELIQNELREIKERYGDERRTEIIYAGDDISLQELIPDEYMVITITHEGYIKRTPLSEYRTQSRGGVGSKGVATKDADYIEHLFVANTHSYLFIFTKNGKLFWLKVYEIPEGSKASKGRAIQNLINIEPQDSVRAVVNVNNLSDEEFVKNNYIVMCTEKGTVKKTLLEAFSRPRVNGINAISVNEGDRLLNVKLTDGHSDIVLGLKSGRAIRFNEENVRPMGRNAAGVRGVSLAGNDDAVVGMATISDAEEQSLLVVSEKGFGKRTPVEEYRITNRGGKGVKTLNLTGKTGNLVSLLDVTDDNELLIINKSGVVIRLAVSSLRNIGRATQGVKLIKLSEQDSISSVAKIDKMDDEASDAAVDNQSGNGQEEGAADTE